MKRQIKIALIIFVLFVLLLIFFIAKFFILEKFKNNIADFNNDTSTSGLISSLDLIEEDFANQKISAAEYFLQKIAYSFGSPLLNQKYINEADQQANQNFSCGTPVFEEIYQYQQDKQADPQALEAINTFFNLKESFEYFQSQQPISFLDKISQALPAQLTPISANVSGSGTCQYGSNYCRFPSNNVKNAVKQTASLLRSLPPSGDVEWQARVNSVYLAEKMFDLNKCICAEAGDGHIVEVYYQEDARYAAEKIQAYLEADKPWNEFKKQIYVYPAPDPKSFYDLSSDSWISSQDNSLQVYLTPGLRDTGVSITPTITRGTVKTFRSAIFLDPDRLNAQSIQIKERQNNATSISQDDVILGTLIHEMIHVFTEVMSRSNNFKGNDEHYEGLTVAMERYIYNRNLAHALITDSEFLNNRMLTTLYDLTERDSYEMSLAFRYMALLNGSNTPFRDYLKELATRDSADILFKDYFSVLGAKFAATNLNLNYPTNIDSQIFQYPKNDAVYPIGFSVPSYKEKVIKGDMQIKTSDKQEIKSLSVGSGQVYYQIINYLEPEENHRYIEIDHAAFTGYPNRELGVLLLHIDPAIDKTEKNYAPYILGDTARPILSASYYEYDQYDAKAEICLDSEPIKPNVIILIFANNDPKLRADITSSAPITISTRSSCEPIGNYLDLEGSAARSGSQQGFISCAPSTSQESYKIKANLTDLVFEEEQKPKDNDAIGSASGILASFRLKKGKITFSQTIDGQINDPCINTDSMGNTVCTGSRDPYLYSHKNTGTGIDLDQWIAQHPEQGELGQTNGRLVFYNNGKYTFTLRLNAGEGSAFSSLSTPTINCGSATASLYPITKEETAPLRLEYILRTHGEFNDGATQISDSETIPFVISPSSFAGTQNGVMLPLSNDRGLFSLFSAVQVGNMSAKWKFEFPEMKHCTLSNQCLSSEESEPTPPKYWDLPAFCEIWTKNYDILKCGLWEAQIFASTDAASNLPGLQF